VHSRPTFIAEASPVTRSGPGVASGIAGPDNICPRPVANAFPGVALVFGAALAATSAAAIVATLLLPTIGDAGQTDTLRTTGEVLPTDPAATAAPVISTLLSKATGDTIGDALAGNALLSEAARTACPTATVSAAHLASAVRHAISYTVAL